MLRRLWQWIKDLLQKLFGHRQSPPDNATPEPSTESESQLPVVVRSDTELESLFLELLEGVSQGWSRGYLQGFFMGKKLKPTDFIPWLQRFGEKLQESPTQHEELARRLVMLGQLDLGELSRVAEEIGRRLEAEIPKPVKGFWDEVIDAEFVGDGLGGNSQLEPSGSGEQNGETLTLDELQARLQQDANFRNQIAEALQIQTTDPQSIIQALLNQVNEPPDSTTSEAEIWFNRGNEQYKRGNFVNAIASYDKALAIKPDYHEAWNNRGVALRNLGRIEEAIASCDKALALNPDYHQAWMTAGIAVGLLSQFQLQSPHLLGLHNPILKQWGYQGEINVYREGLKHCLENTHPEGWGKLHYYIGRSHYFQGRRNPNDRPLWREAVQEYNLALKTLTLDACPECRLAVLQDYLKILLAWKQTDKAEEIQRKGTDSLRRLLSECKSPGRKQQLEREFASFRQLTVDLTIQTGNLVNALELAEKGKNTCLSWFLSDYDQSPTYRQIHQLLTPSTAILYWHLSPIALHAFLLTLDTDIPILLSTPSTDQALQQLQRFETWVETWNEQYANYRKTKTAEAKDSTWRDTLPQHLRELSQILNIPQILDSLNNKPIQNLILIPHRDLHRFPVHALFPDKFTITYLPSAQMGIERLNLPTSPTEQPLLCIKHPGNDPKNQLLFADVEAPAITFLHDGILCEDEDAIKTKTDEDSDKATALEQIVTGRGYLHFTCHGEHNFHQPSQSALELHQEFLTLQEIIKLQLQSYELACLSACETGLTSNQTITTEFVGLSSAFLAAGVTSVMSTLWSVEDVASAILIVKFYELLKTNPPVIALKAAQTWLRTLTYADLIDWCDRLVKNEDLADYSYRCQSSLEDSNSVFRTEASLKGLEFCPYSNPYYWAGYIITSINPC